MSAFGDRLALLFDRLLEEFGGIAFAYAQGTNGRSVLETEAFAKDLVLAGTSGLDQDRRTFVIRGTVFATGFSGTNPVTPAPGDTLTVASEGVWEVLREGDSVKSVNSGQVFVLRCSRRSQPGSA